MLVVRSRCCAELLSILLRQGQHGGRLIIIKRLTKTFFKGLEGRRRFLFQLFSAGVEVSESFLLRRGLQDLIQYLVHLVSVAGGRLVQDVPLEVYTEEFLGMTPLPDQAREGLL